MNAASGESPLQPRQLEEFHATPNRPGLRLRELVGPELGEHGHFVLELVMEPGAEVPLHTHTVSESVVVLEGALTMHAGEQEVVVEAGHAFLIPPGTLHGIVNRGAEASRLLGSAAWDQTSFFTEATVYRDATPLAP